MITIMMMINTIAKIRFIIIILFIFHHHDGQFHLSERVGNAAYQGLNPWLNGTVALYQNCPRSASFMFHLMKMMKIMMVILFSTAIIRIWRGRTFFDPLPQFPCICHVVRQSHAEKWLTSLNINFHYFRAWILISLIHRLGTGSYTRPTHPHREGNGGAFITFFWPAPDEDLIASHWVWTW